VAPFYRSRLETLAAPASGFFLLSNLGERWHRIQSIVRDGVVYQPVDPKRFQLEGGEKLSGPDYSWARLGDEVWLFPTEGSSSVEVRYSSRPAGFTSLEADDLVEWPEGYDSVWLHEIVGRGLAKGAAEDGSDHLRISTLGMQRLKAELGRTHSGPSTVMATSRAVDWGGQ
jgi:hypothetical protein